MTAAGAGLAWDLLMGGHAAIAVAQGLQMGCLEAAGCDNSAAIVACAPDE